MASLKAEKAGEFQSLSSARGLQRTPLIPVGARRLKAKSLGEETLLYKIFGHFRCCSEMKWRPSVMSEAHMLLLRVRVGTGIKNNPPPDIPEYFM